MTSTPALTPSEAARTYRDWLQDAALPLWAGAGQDPATGAFHDLLALDGSPVAAPMRARVQARQVFVYASAAQAGLGASWLDVARRGFSVYRAYYRRPDGLFAILADAQGSVLDDTPRLYEQAFSLLAMAALHAAGERDRDHPAEALRLLEALQPRHLSAGGFRELTKHPFQANATMHLLEAVMAWEALHVSPVWPGLADELAELCLARFIDADGGFLREFFDEHWRPAAGDDGRMVEPGHQFEWAWLLERWGVARKRADARAAARTLFQRGLVGVDRRRGVAINGLWDDLSVRDPVARLWPQTEYLKAALILGDEAEALVAAKGLARYLDVPKRGAWRDKMLADGRFVEEPAPASSFYHIVVAFLELLRRP